MHEAGRLSRPRAALRDAKLVWWLAVMRLALSVLGYRRLRRVLPGCAGDATSPHHARNVARRIESVARFVPGASCLTQALALQFILARQGHRATIRIGVSAAHPANAFASPDFSAHAWVECAGHVVLGHRRTDISGFTPIAELR